MQPAGVSFYEEYHRVRERQKLRVEQMSEAGVGAFMWWYRLQTRHLWSERIEVVEQQDVVRRKA